MKKINLLALLAIFFVTSCSSSKNIKFTQKDNEFQTTPALSTFLDENKNPKVVLRVNDNSQKVTDQEDKSYLYNAIENQLMASGFIVRDRQLFNQIIGNDKNNVNYDNLKKTSDTDLIIELTKLDPSVVYETNISYDDRGREKTHDYATKQYGATVEYKVVMINNNEFAGLYRFNYTPCIEGCIIKKSAKDYRKELKAMRKAGVQPYEGVEKDELEDFMKNSAKMLVEAMRN